MEDENTIDKLPLSDIEARNRKIKKEIEKLEKLFEKIDPSRKSLAEKLINNAAYMSVELEYLKEHNVEHGIKEVYMNGANQFGYKESVESKTYGTMIKNYSNIIKQLNDMLPPTELKVDEDDFDNFGEDT